MPGIIMRRVSFQTVEHELEVSDYKMENLLFMKNRIYTMCYLEVRNATVLAKE